MNRKILVIGSNSSLAEDAVGGLVSGSDNMVGLHYAVHCDRIFRYERYPNVCFLQKKIGSEADCRWVVEEYAKWAGGEIHHLLVMLGGVGHLCDWRELTVEDMQLDYLINAVFPLMLAKYAGAYMRDKGGNITFISTSSARHGGGRRTLGYGMGKSALECAVRRLAKDLAEYRIAVNAVAPGFFDTDSQAKFKSEEEIERRASSIPMGRPGSKREFADIILGLVKYGGGYMTGQVIPVDGGDFI